MLYLFFNVPLLPLLLLLTASCLLLTSSCGTATFFTAEEVVKPAVKEADRNVTIQTGDHVHTFPKEFIAATEAFGKADRKGWEQARNYFKAAQQNPAIDRFAAMYGEGVADLVISLADLNQITVVLLGLVGVKAPPRDTPSLFMPARTPYLHAGGDLSHGPIEDIFERFLLDFVEKNVPRLEEILQSDDFMFPAKRVTLAVSAAGTGAQAELIGYHNKMTAGFSRDFLRTLGVGANILAGVRFDSGKLIKTVAGGQVNLDAILSSIFVAEGAKSITSLLNTDPTLLTFYPEHMEKAEALFFELARSTFSVEIMLEDNPGHYTNDFLASIDSEGYLGFTVSAETTSATGTVRYTKPEEWLATAKPARDAVIRHLDNPKDYPLVNASDLFGTLLNEVSTIFTSILTEALVGSLISGESISSATQSGLTDLFDTISGSVAVISGLQAGIDRSVFLVDAHKLFGALENARDYLPAWTSSAGADGGYFLVEYECGVKAPVSEVTRQTALESSAATCRSSLPLTDSTHFSETQDLTVSQLGARISRIGGILLEDPSFQHRWQAGVPKDGKRSPYLHVLWQEPTFGGAVYVDPTSLDWARYGVFIPEGSTVPCGLKPEIQTLSGPEGVCFLNLLIDVLAGTS